MTITVVELVVAVVVGSTRDQVQLPSKVPPPVVVVVVVVIVVHYKRKGFILINLDPLGEEQLTFPFINQP